MEDRLKALYKEVKELLSLAPDEDNCSYEDNEVFDELANLKQALFDAGYGE